MFWITSIAALLTIAFALRCLHTSNMPFRWFISLLIASLLTFNLAIAFILALYWIDAHPWTKPKMFFGLIGIAFLFALLLRICLPAHSRHLNDHRKLIKTYAAILIAAGFVGGLVFGSPALVGDYVIKSDRWADVATAITTVEITSLYSLALTLILSIGSSIGEIKRTEGSAG